MVDRRYSIKAFMGKKADTIYPLKFEPSDKQLMLDKFVKNKRSSFIEIWNGFKN